VALHLSKPKKNRTIWPKSEQQQDKKIQGQCRSKVCSNAGKHEKGQEWDGCNNVNHAVLAVQSSRTMQLTKTPRCVNNAITFGRESFFYPIPETIKTVLKRTNQFVASPLDPPTSILMEAAAFGYPPLWSVWNAFRWNSVCLYESSSARCRIYNGDD